MAYVIGLIFFAGAAIYFAVRFFSLRHGIGCAVRELKEISAMPEENRVLKAEIPDPYLERFLEEVNEYLAEIQRYRIRYKNQEIRLKEQIEEISHDLRTPLTAILGYLKTMDQTGLSADDREAMEVVIRKSKTLQALINQFYELSQVSAEDFKVETELLDAVQLVKESCLAHYNGLEQRKLKVTMNLPSEPLWISADKNGLERVFSNLLKNVERYARSEFYVCLKRDDGGIRIIFGNDIEAGMRLEDPEKLFDRFYMGAASRSQGGTGLGLTISRHLVTSMGGRIHAVYREANGKDYLEIEIFMA